VLAHARIKVVVEPELARTLPSQWSVEPPTDHTESIEVMGSYCRLGANPSVLYAVADRLSQPEGMWQPFDRSGMRSGAFPDPKRAIKNRSHATPASLSAKSWSWAENLFVSDSTTRALARRVGRNNVHTAQLTHDAAVARRLGVIR
jgi:hypothetical protein